MSEPDVVAELRGYLQALRMQSDGKRMPDAEVMLGVAIDEILVLRSKLQAEDRIVEHVRAAALEEAAQTIERQPWPPLGPSRDVLAATIRALKDKRDE